MKRQVYKLWPIFIIFLVWFIFSSPYFIQGKAPFPGDNQQYAFSPWDGYVVKGSIKNPAITDVISQIYPWKYFTIESLRKGIIPFWNPYSFSGTVHLANYQSAVLSPLNFLFFLFPFIDAWSMLILLQPLLAGIFMYVFMRSLKVSKAGGFISAVGFMFCGFMTVWMAYGTLDYAILFLPLALFSIEKFYETEKSRYGLLLAMTVLLSFLSGHFQISLYFLIFINFYLLFKLGVNLKNKGAKETSKLKILTTLSLLLYTFLGLLIAMPQIIPSVQVYIQSLRSTFFQKGEAIPLAYLPTLLSPDFFGNPVTRNDWFGHYAEWNNYIGILPIMLAMYAILKGKSAHILFLFIYGVASLLFAFATPFLPIIISLHIPVLSTSAASRIIVLFSFSFLVLAGIGWDSFIEDVKNKKMRIIFVWLGLFSLLFFCLWSIVIFKLFLPVDRIAIAKQNLVLPTMFFACSVFIILSTYFLRFSGMTFLHFARNDKARSGITILLILITVVDLLRFATKWQPFSPKMEIFSNTPVTNFFAKTNTYERTLGNYGAETAVYFHLPAVDGYDAVYNQRYGEFITFVNSGKFGESEKSLVRFEKNGVYTNKAVNLLNIRYILHKITDGHMPWEFPVWSYPNGVFTLAYHDSAYEVYKNNTAFPRAFLVNHYIVEGDPKKMLVAMFNNNFDLRHEVVVEKDPGISQKGENIGFATITTYNPNAVIIETNAKSPALLFLSDSYNPDWQAVVDEQQTSIFRTDYTFRSVKVPAGKHRVKFYYYPKSFIWGLWLAVVGGMAIILLLIPFKKRIY